MCLVFIYCLREDRYIRRSVYGGQDRDVIYTKKGPPSEHLVRVWSANNMRDTVADPRLMVINKPGFGAHSSGGNSARSDGADTAGFGRSPSEIVLKSKDNDFELSTQYSSLSPRKTLATDPFRVNNRVIGAGGQDGLNGVILEADANDEYTTAGNRNSIAPRL